MQATATAQKDFSAQVSALTASRAMTVTRLTKQQSARELVLQIVNDTPGPSDETMSTSSVLVAEVQLAPPSKRAPRHQRCVSAAPSRRSQRSGRLPGARSVSLKPSVTSPAASNDDAKPDSPVAQHRLNALTQNVEQIEANNGAFAAHQAAASPVVSSPTSENFNGNPGRHHADDVGTPIPLAAQSARSRACRGGQGTHKQQNPKYTMASLLGDDSCRAPPEAGQQLPGLAFVLQQRSCAPPTPECPGPKRPVFGAEPAEWTYGQAADKAGHRHEAASVRV
ncbi:hypothetical protein ON010_g11222 [Phytophthora cinnamomi]|nr:hypothetical protein ON010_g11222 [Phytophthora cinnamomi]